MKSKYVSFKADAWDAFIGTLVKKIEEPHHSSINPQALLDSLPDPIEDAEVVRHQDMISASLFYTASSIYQSYVELIGDKLPKENVKYLREVAEHFFQAAERAQSLPYHKLPD